MEKFGRSRNGEDRFYNPSKARSNRQFQENLRRAQSDVTETDSTTSCGAIAKALKVILVDLFCCCLLINCSESQETVINRKRKEVEVFVDLVCVRNRLGRVSF
ncbi:hypothetical protein HanRHA438_Chr08g0351641 [Helianthus annuus]|nr:hypothetical protein HanHA300_Chr08g0281151 [Helianthus annuus]KAJ0547030.1 hypothetical protein HanIR_Chr08g0367491 [Helianthus annuus]KAJ0553620.1 hypothetical protein HanHA89_Chr08g0298401 [Helianthus annuus]KAJ0897977.1 hypothetical protein HanRHA438_Chr08g0351641 [Helianthus annuus]